MYGVMCHAVLRGTAPGMAATGAMCGAAACGAAACAAGANSCSRACFGQCLAAHSTVDSTVDLAFLDEVCDAAWPWHHWMMEQRTWRP